MKYWSIGKPRISNMKIDYLPIKKGPILNKKVKAIDAATEKGQHSVVILTRSGQLSIPSFFLLQFPGTPLLAVLRSFDNIHDRV
jgi:protein tyrosine phosphatase (PTP) superfamily phosphohydrolase (DUF442 family)